MTDYRLCPLCHELIPEPDYPTHVKVIHDIDLQPILDSIDKQCYYSYGQLAYEQREAN